MLQLPALDGGEHDSTLSSVQVPIIEALDFNFQIGEAELRVALLNFETGLVLALLSTHCGHR